MGLLTARNVVRDGQRATYDGQRDRRRQPPASMRGALGHRDGDGVPGPDDLAQPGDEDRHARSPRASRYHLDIPKDEADEHGARSCSTRSASPSPSAGSTQYPHQLSGGMRQRVDDRHRAGLRPQAAVRRRADHRPRRHRAGPDPRPAPASSSASGYMAMMLVTHDLGVVAGRTDEIAVMYAGQIVEKAPDPHALRQHAHAVHRGAAQVDPEARAPEPHPARRRSAAARRTSINPPHGLPVRAPLPVRAGPVPRRRSRRSSRPTRPATCSAAGSRSAPPPARRRSSANLAATCREAADRRLGRRRTSRASAPSPTSEGRPDGRHRHRPPAADDDALLRVEDLVVEFPAGRGGTVHAVSGHQPRRASRARRSASSASPAAASRPPAGRSCSCPPPTAGTVLFEGTDLTALQRRGAARGPARAADDLPGPDLVAEPAPQGRATSSPSRCASGSGGTDAEQKARVDEVLDAVGLDPEVAAAEAARTSSPAASASASRSPGRWCSTRR